MEPTVKIEFNAAEVQTLGVLIDAAVKALGIQVAKPAATIFEKLERAVAEVNASNGVLPQGPDAE